MSTDLEVELHNTLALHDCMELLKHLKYAKNHVVA